MTRLTESLKAPSRHTFCPYRPLHDHFVTAARKITRHSACSGLTRLLPIQKIVAVFRVFADLHDPNEKLPYGLLLQTVHGPISVLLWDDQSERRVDVVANFLSPSRNKALDDVLTNFMRGRIRGPMGTLLLSRNGRPCGLLLVLVQRVEKG